MQCELLCTFQTYVAFAYLFVKLKRAAHGPHRSYEKHFQAINKPKKSYDYIQTNWLKVAIVYRLKGMQASIWTKNPHHEKMPALCEFCLLVVLEKFFFLIF